MDFRGQPQRRAPLLVGCQRLLCLPKVNELHPAKPRYNDILRLNVAVNYATLAQVLHGEREL